MNFKEIQRLYPNTFNRLASWIGENFLAISLDSKQFEYHNTNGTKLVTRLPRQSVGNRYLYDFFDENREFVVIEYNRLEQKFNREISDRQFNTRKEAEEYAFLCAFQKLENRFYHANIPTINK